MQIKYKYFNSDFDKNFVGENLENLSKLLIELLEKKDNIEINKLYEIVNCFYEFKMEPFDYIEFINKKENTQFDSIIEIPTNMVTSVLESEGHGRDFSWWTENYQKVITVATKNFTLDKDEYTLSDIEKLISNKIIYPISLSWIKTDKKEFLEKDNINYLLNNDDLFKSTEFKKYILSKEIESIGKKEFLNQIRIFIVNLKLNLENYDNYLYYLYDDELEEEMENESIIQLKDKLVSVYNENIDTDKIKLTSIDIIVDYLRNLKNTEFWFEDIDINLVVDTIANLDYEENKELCNEIQRIVIDLKSAELCCELALCCDWIDKKIMGEIVIQDGNPDFNYYFASEVEGADIERHKEVILNSKYTDEYIYERTMKL